MEDKIIALLAAQFSGVRNDGLRQLARILALQCATDEEAKALVEKLTKAQVDGFIKEFRKEVDKEVSDSNKTFEANLKKKFDLVEKKEPPVEPKKDDDPNDIASMAKALLAATAELKNMRTEINGLKTGRVAESRLQSLNEKLKGCKSDEFKAKVLKDFGRMKFETDEEFTEYLADTEKDVTKANQGVADSTLGKQQPPWKSGGQTDKKQASETEIASVVNKLTI